MRLRLAPIVLLPLVLVAACGGGGGSSSPKVSGAYGEKPAITTDGKPGTQRQEKVLRAGTGAPVAKGDLLVADYLGQVWGGKVFDNSYDRGEPAAFPIGVGKVVPGWDKGLVGVKTGSRVLLVLPPADGYGSKGNPQAGIKGTDTLVFVVDVIASYGKDVGGDPKAAVQRTAAREPRVTGALGKQPTVTVPKGLKEPAKISTTVLAKGTGPAVKPGLVVVQFQAVDWKDNPAGSSWQNGQPAGVPVGSQGQPGPFDSLVGVPVGSRVLLEFPAQPAQGQTPASPAVAAAVDVIAQPHPAKATGQ